jgi:hypothetical protein
MLALFLFWFPPGPEEQAYQHDGDIPDDHEEPECAAGQRNITGPYLAPRLALDAGLPRDIHEGKVVRELPRRLPAMRAIVRQGIDGPETPKTNRRPLTGVIRFLVFSLV